LILELSAVIQLCWFQYTGMIDVTLGLIIGHRSAMWLTTVQRELFIKVVSSHSIRMFLEWFTLTQMFDVFITDRLKDDFMQG